GQSTTAQTDPQGDADEEAEAVAAQPAVTPPGTKKSIGRVTEPAPKAAQTLVAKDASETTDATAPVAWPDPPAGMTQRLDPPSPPAPSEETQSDAPAPAVIAPLTAQQPIQQPVAVADSAATTVPAAGGASAVQFV